MDRFQEAHFWIHMLERYYHQADLFRWHLNAYLKAIKEAVSLIGTSLQNHPGFAAWFRGHRDLIAADPLLRRMGKHRDYVVHHGMLRLGSSGRIGITEGRGIKLGFSQRIDPLMDSDEAMDRFVQGMAHAGDFFGFLANDEDSLPCVERDWRLPGLDGEVIDLCATAWMRVGRVIADTLVWLGEDRPDLNLDCRHSDRSVRFKTYDRIPLRRRLLAIRNASGFEMDAEAQDSVDLATEPDLDGGVD